MTSNAGSSIRAVILALLAASLVFVFATCGPNDSVPRPRPKEPEVRLPQFEAQDSDGRPVSSAQLAGVPLVVVLFDTESILAWRTLAKVGQAATARSGGRIAVLGIGSDRMGDSDPDINSAKNEYRVSFPIVFDREKKLYARFQAPNCCDTIFAYDSQGVLRNKAQITQPTVDFSSLVASLADGESGSAEPTPPAKVNFDSLKIRDVSGNEQPLPVSGGGLTIVNLFGEFCTECGTGERMRTLNVLSPAVPQGSKILILYSDKKFSAQDVENFREMLSPAYPLYQGTLGEAESNMNGGHLLVIFDSNKKVLWQEVPGLPEGEVFAKVTRVIQDNQ
jgi:peroxiredoxin